MRTDPEFMEGGTNSRSLVIFLVEMHACAPKSMPELRVCGMPQGNK